MLSPPPGVYTYLERDSVTSRSSCEDSIGFSSAALSDPKKANRNGSILASEGQTSKRKLVKKGSKVRIGKRDNGFTRKGSLFSEDSAVAAVGGSSDTVINDVSSVLPGDGQRPVPTRVEGQDLAREHLRNVAILEERKGYPRVAEGLQQNAAIPGDGQRRAPEHEIDIGVAEQHLQNVTVPGDGRRPVLANAKQPDAAEEHLQNAGSHGDAQCSMPAHEAKSIVEEEHLQNATLLQDGQRRKGRRCCCLWRRRNGFPQSGKIATACSFDSTYLPSYYEWPGDRGRRLPDLVKQSSPIATLRIFCGSWNLGREPLCGDFGNLLKAMPPRHHIYAVGFCECSHGSIEDELVGYLGDDYILIGQECLREIRLGVAVTRSLFPLCHDLKIATVATGIANIYGNKGGVHIGFRVGNTKLCFISAHLNAGEGEQFFLRRNQDFARVLLHSNLGGVHGAYDYVFVMGDLNFRIRAKRDTVEDWVGNQEFMNCLACDELLPQLHGKIPFNEGEPQRASRAIANNETDVSARRHTAANQPRDSVMASELPTRPRPRATTFWSSIPFEAWTPPGLWPLFNEAAIAFPPTYKFDCGTDNFDSSPKQRVPSWTDRILWRRHLGVRAMAYESVRGLRRSDHRPVFAQFEVEAEIWPAE